MKGKATTGGGKRLMLPNRKRGLCPPGESPPRFRKEPCAYFHKKFYEMWIHELNVMIDAEGYAVDEDLA